MRNLCEHLFAINKPSLSYKRSYDVHKTFSPFSTTFERPGLDLQRNEISPFKYIHRLIEMLQNNTFSQQKLKLNFILVAFYDIMFDA